MQEYKKIQLVDNWGTKSYVLKEDENKTINFYNGQRVRVAWPDGSTTKERIVMEPYTETVYDQGAPPQTVNGELATLRFELRGTKETLSPENFMKLRFHKGDLKYAIIKR